MALGEVHLRDVGRVLRKEMTTSLMIAVTLGLAGCVRAWMMGIGMEITLIVSLTLVCITLWSAIVSSVIPMVLKRCGIDPAVVSAPFIATLIDGTGLIIYFKIAQYTLGLEYAMGTSARGAHAVTYHPTDARSRAVAEPAPVSSSPSPLSPG
jgi:magnesium transporter